MSRFERPSKGEVAGIVLAAGRSLRFASESPKQLLSFNGEPLVRRAARTALASKLAEVVVVVGHQAEAVRAAVSDLPVRVIENPDFKDGQSTSIRAGLQGLESHLSATLFLPCDQPFLNVELIDRLLAAFHDSGKGVVQPIYETQRSFQRRGAPVLWARRFFPALLKLQGDVGGRVLLDGLGQEIGTVAVDDERLLLDIDTLEDWAELTARDEVCRKER